MNNRLHNRRSIRLPDYDYTKQGWYYITICTKNRTCLFGNVIQGALILNEFGTIARNAWMEIPLHFPNVVLDEFVVMPNHVHGLFAIQNRFPVGATHVVGATHASPLRDDVPKNANGPKSGSVGAIVGAYKSVVSKNINQVRQTPGEPVWQRNYYERVVRENGEVDRIRRYIAENPQKWQEDDFFK